MQLIKISLWMSAVSKSGAPIFIMIMVHLRCPSLQIIFSRCKRRCFFSMSQIYQSSYFFQWKWNAYIIIPTKIVTSTFIEKSVKIIRIGFAYHLAILYVPTVKPTQAFSLGCQITPLLRTLLASRDSVGYLHDSCVRLIRPVLLLVVVVVHGYWWSY